MSAIDLTQNITLILSVSVAGERLVALVKTIVPWLNKPTDPITPTDDDTEKYRKIALMVIAFLCCWLTAYLLPVKPEFTSTPLLGLLASGGSAFWTSLLGYTKAVSEIKVQNVIQEKVNSQLKLHAFESIKFENRINLALRRIENLTPPKFNQQHNIKNIII